MLRRVVPANCAIDKGTRECTGIRGVEEVRDVERRGRQAVENTNCPTIQRETPVPSADVALCVGMHVGKAGVPEEPDVLLIEYGFGMKEIMIDLDVWAYIEEMIGNDMKPR